MTQKIQIGTLEVELELKNIKHIHLSVNPPFGAVKITAPLKSNIEAIRGFAASRIGWIRAQQKKMMHQERAEPLDFITRESHYVWGKRYLLEVVEHDAAPSIELDFNKIVLKVRPSTSTEKRAETLDAWYRSLVKQASPKIMANLAPSLGVTLPRLHVQRMKTRWGSFCSKSNSIRLNSELAKKPPECLEYILAHEMAHQVEHTHGDKFRELLDRVVPKWEFSKDMLSRLPLRDEDWSSNEKGKNKG